MISSASSLVREISAYFNRLLLAVRTLEIGNILVARLRTSLQLEGRRLSLCLTSRWAARIFPSGTGTAWDLAPAPAL